VLVFLFQTVRALFAIAIIHSDGPNTHPFALVYVDDPDDPNKSYDDGVIYIRTRCVPAAKTEDLSETDTDRGIKDKFLEAIGDQFDPEKLTFLVKPHEGIGLKN